MKLMGRPHLSAALACALPHPLFSDAEASTAEPGAASGGLVERPFHCSHLLREVEKNPLNFASGGHDGSSLGRLRQG